ncbi:MAG TPA: MMPL family transporter [Solirubrobacteraceae bacterium]|jgi:RND superfamily putative drug exporter
MSTLARFVLRHPRKIVAFWVVLLLLSGVGASRLGDRVQNGGYYASGSQSQRAAALEDRLFGASPAPQAYLSLLAAHGSQAVSSPDVVLAARTLRGVRGVKTVGSPALSRNGRAALFPVAFAGDLGYAQTRMPDAASALSAAHLSTSKAQLIGEGAVYERYMVQSKKSLQTSSLISFPVTLVILLVAFLSVAAALMPLGLAAVCVGVTFGFLYLLTYIVQLSVFVEDTVLILGLGLSIDFSLFMVTRVREALARDGVTVEQAITEALQTTGRAITVSGLTVATALAGLYVTGLGVFSSLATGAIGAALIAVAAALTLTPAALVLLGERLDRFSIKVAVTAAQNGAFWRRLADFVVRRRVVVVAVIVPVMVVLSIPIGGMHITLKSIGVLPPSDPVRVATGRVADSFGPGSGTPAVVLAQTSPARLRQVVGAQPGVVQVGPAEPGGQGWVRVPATLAAYSDSPKADTIVRNLRSSLRRAFGPRAVVGGATAVGLDLIQRINERTPLVVLVVLLAEILVLTLIFAAPLIALKAALTTLLSVSAALGVMTFFFRGTGDIGYFVPLFLFATIFGLSTDYEVFLLSRVREHHREGASNTDSLKRALIGSSRSITLAGITMSVVFFAFAASPLIPFQELGVGMGLSILLDVTVVRGLLVPATVAMLGEANWWRPQWTGRLIGRRGEPVVESV